MEAWLVVWLVVGLVTTVALLVMLGFLVRHVILLGRTAGRMQEELQPIAVISAENSQAKPSIRRVKFSPSCGTQSIR